MLDYQAPSRAVNRPLHVAAVVTACCTFPLIFLGGLVTSHGAGMSVPDWPNSYGYNMFLFPPRLWVGGIFYAHTHRLLGSLVGFCATVLTLVAWGPAVTPRGRRWIGWGTVLVLIVNAIGTGAMMVDPAAFHVPVAARSVGNIASQGIVGGVGILLCAGVALLCRSPEPRRWVRWVATSCLIAVCLQGLLGGLRVDLINLTLAIVHGCFAQATFCLMILTAAVTGKRWATTPLALRGEKTLTVLACATVAVIYCQLIVAATMRHNGAGLAIPDLPLAYGHLLPPTNASQLAVANHQRVWQLGLDPVTLPQVWLHFAHRVGAVVVSGFVLSLVGSILIRHPNRWLATPAVTLAVLLVTQVTLGILTVYYRKPADVASAHVAVGALTLATAFLIAVRVVRMNAVTVADRSQPRPVRREVEAVLV